MNDARLPLTQHLAELRGRLFKMVIAWVIGTALAWSFSEEIFRYLLEPAVSALGGDGRPLQAIAPTEIFFTYLKCALLAGFLLSLPVLFWQAWAFVAPGLYPSEKNAALPFVPSRRCSSAAARSSATPWSSRSCSSSCRASTTTSSSPPGPCARSSR